MSVTGNNQVGIPIILLYDSLGGQISVELKDGCSYTGILDDVQDNMNMTLKGPLVRIDLDGNKKELSMVYVRGSQVCFIVLPDILREAPYFQRIHIWRKYKGRFIYGSGEQWVQKKLRKPAHLEMGPMGIGVNQIPGPSPGTGFMQGPPPVGFGYPTGPPPGFIPGMQPLGRPMGPPPGYGGNPVMGSNAPPPPPPPQGP